MCLPAFWKSTVFPRSPMLVLSSCFWILPLESVQSLLGLFYFTPWVCDVHSLASPTTLTPFYTLAQSCAQLQLQGSPPISSKVSCLQTIFVHATYSSWNLSPQALPNRLLLFPQLCTWPFLLQECHLSHMKIKSAWSAFQSNYQLKFNPRCDLLIKMLSPQLNCRSMNIWYFVVIVIHCILSL